MNDNIPHKILHKKYINHISVHAVVLKLQSPQNRGSFCMHIEFRKSEGMCDRRRGGDFYISLKYKL